MKNMRTYESINDSSLLYVPAKEMSSDGTYEACGTSEGAPNQTMIFDLNSKF